MRQHCGEIAGGARYTRSRRPVRLVWKSAETTLSNALKAERKLKKLSRSRKERFVAWEGYRRAWSEMKCLKL